MNEAPKKQIPTKKKKGLKIFLIIFGVLVALCGIVIGAFELVLEHYAGMISTEVSEEWSGVNIDDPSYDIGGEYYDESDFSDPEWDEDISSLFETSLPDISFDESSTASGGKTSRPPVSYPPYEPDYGIISGLFDESGDLGEEYNADVINILLIGADTISGKSARSDTMIVLSINNTKKRITFLSLMRDTYVAINGYKNNRLNAAYSAGGATLLLDTIHKNFGLRIDYYAAVGYDSFKQAVKALGGMELTVNEDNYDYFAAKGKLSGMTKAEALDGKHTLHLNEGEALAYARARHLAGSDFTRTLHQRDILTQFVNNCKDSSISELNDMLATVLPYIKTNIPKSMLKMLVRNTLSYVSYSVDDGRVPYAGTFKNQMINGRAVLVVDLAKNREYILRKLYS